MQRSASIFGDRVAACFAIVVVKLTSALLLAARWCDRLTVGGRR